MKIHKKRIKSGKKEYEYNIVFLLWKPGESREAEQYIRNHSKDELMQKLIENDLSTRIDALIDRLKHGVFPVADTIKTESQDEGTDILSFCEDFTN